MTPVATMVRDMRASSPLLWRGCILMAAGLITCIGLMLLDHRLINGIPVWDKPAKFFLSLIVQFATVAFALSQMPVSRGTRWAMGLMSFAAAFELVYICFRAARGEASHFNHSSLSANILYGLMGIGAITISLSALFIGIRLWRLRHESLVHEAVSLGLIIGMALGSATGVFLSQQSGHWVGGELSDAHGLGFFSWSTTGGDLRVAHFMGLHTAQAVPLAALTNHRIFIYLTALICTLLCAFAFVQAVMGIPLFRV